MDKITEPAKLKAATTYNAAADHFDDGPLAFWDRYGRETIERLQLKPGSIVLDVGCGSGASAIPAAKAVGPHGRVIERRGAGSCLAMTTLTVSPSVGRKTSAPRTCLTPLNTSPAPSPVNASRLSSRTTRASLGASAVRYSFTVTDFHRLPLAGLPAQPSNSINGAGHSLHPLAFVVQAHLAYQSCDDDPAFTRICKTSWPRSERRPSA